MKRITELAIDYASKQITAKQFRSAMVAQLTMLDDVQTKKLCARILQEG